MEIDIPYMEHMGIVCWLIWNKKVPRSNSAKKHSDVAVEVAVNPIIYSLI